MEKKMFSWEIEFDDGVILRCAGRPYQNINRAMATARAYATRYWKKLHVGHKRISASKVLPNNRI